MSEPKPLDLENSLEEIEKEFSEELKNDEFIEDLIEKIIKEKRGNEDLFRFRDEIRDLIELAIREFLLDVEWKLKQRIKSACEFYLRYKDNPELLMKEHPELASEQLERWAFESEWKAHADLSEYRL